MKTTPMKHQMVGCALLAEHPDFFALGAEQGTGKTWMLIADAEWQFNQQHIEAVLVIAPKGVHTNWVLRELPKHASVPISATFWLSGAPQKHMKPIARQLSCPPPGQLVVHAMNVDAVNTTAGFAQAKAFLKKFRTLMIIDESQRIKNPAALRTKRIIELGRLAVSRRIASGTLVSNSPLDLFSQFDFLAPGLLGTTSYRAFVAEYAVLLPLNSPLVQDIIRRTRARGCPQVIAHDRSGRPLFQNVEKLRGFMTPHLFRVTKEECLDLPPKVYQTVFFELLPEQRKIYETVKAARRWERNDGEIDAFTALTVINKLRQVTSGFILVDGEPVELKNAQPRISALKEVIEDCEGQIIVWASFREELRIIEEELKDLGVVSYHGGTSAADREAAVDAFQSGAARIFLGNPAAAGTGLTLTAARTVIYYSSSFSLEERLQSEDRAHRIGTDHSVLYVDLVARETIDERIASALQAKEEIAAKILDNI